MKSHRIARRLRLWIDQQFVGLAASLFVSKALDLAGTILVARAFGPSVLGCLAISNSYGALGSRIGDMGLPALVQRSLASGESTLDLASIRAARWLIAAVTGLAAVGAVTVILPGDQLGLAFCAVSALQIVGASELLASSLLAVRRVLAVGAALVLGRASQLLAIALACWTNAGTTILGLALLMGAVVQVATLEHFNRRASGRGRNRVNIPRGLRTTIANWRLGIVAFLPLLYDRMPVLVGGMRLPTTDIGQYSAAAAFYQSAYLLIIPLNRPALTELSRARRNPAAFSRELRQLVWRSLLLGVLLLFGIWLGGGLLLDLAYGSRFVRAKDLLPVFGLAALFLSINVAFLTALTALRSDRLLLLVGLACGLSSPVAALTLIANQGLLGLALSHLCIELLCATVAAFLLWSALSKRRTANNCQDGAQTEESLASTSAE